MRDILTFTIDPDTAKDFDDALSVEWINGKLQVGVHIADVSHYVRPDTDLDKEAYKRAEFNRNADMLAKTMDRESLIQSLATSLSEMETVD